MPVSSLFWWTGSNPRYESELAALGGAGSGSSLLGAAAQKSLSLLAKGGPTRAALLEQVRQQRRILSEDTVASTASWSDKLLKLSDSIVQVRRVDDAASTTPAGLTAALEQALATGDIAAASGFWAKLPEPARRATVHLGANLASRAGADTALKTPGRRGHCGAGWTMSCNLMIIMTDRRVNRRALMA
jgi:hypothetical protein